METTTTKNRKILVRTLLLKSINNYVQDTKKLKNNLNRCSELSMESEHLSNQTNLFLSQVRYFNQVLNLDLLDSYKFELTNRGLTVSFTETLDFPQYNMLGKEFKFHIGLKRKNSYENINSYSLKFYVEINQNDLYEFKFLSFNGESAYMGDNKYMTFDCSEKAQKIHDALWDEFGSGDSTVSYNIINENFDEKIIKSILLYELYSLEEKLLSLVNLNTYNKPYEIKNNAF